MFGDDPIESLVAGCLAPTFNGISNFTRLEYFNHNTTNQKHVNRQGWPISVQNARD